MILTIGSYSFAVNEVWFIPTSRMRVGQTGRYLYDEVNWTIHDVIFSNSQASLTTAIAARENAVRNITGDVIFYESDGLTETAHKITYANTIEGIKARVIEYPGGLSAIGGRAFGSGSEYADATSNYRYLVTQISARVLNVENEVAFYWQTFRYSLGGTQFAVQGSFQGPPRRFNIMQSVPNWAIQKGRIIGVTGYPPLPNTIVGSLALDPQRSWAEPETPQLIGSINQLMFPTAFYYYFRDPLPMAAVPPPTI